MIWYHNVTHSRQKSQKVTHKDFSEKIQLCNVLNFKSNVLTSSKILVTKQKWYVTKMYIFRLNPCAFGVQVVFWQLISICNISKRCWTRSCIHVFYSGLHGTTRHYKLVFPNQTTQPICLQCSNDNVLLFYLCCANNLTLCYQIFTKTVMPSLN